MRRPFSAAYAPCAVDGRSFSVAASSKTFGIALAPGGGGVADVLRLFLSTGVTALGVDAPPLVGALTSVSSFGTLDLLKGGVLFRPGFVIVRFMAPLTPSASP